MQKAKIKFHQPTMQEMQSQKMNTVFQMLRKQQDGIQALLKKYRNSQDQDPDEYFPQKQKDKHNKHTKEKCDSSRKLRSLRKSSQKQRYLLPEIRYSGKQNQRAIALSQRKSKKNSQTVTVQKTYLGKELYQIYSDQKLLRKMRNQKEIRPFRSKSIQRSRLASQQVVYGNQQKVKPKPKKIGSGAHTLHLPRQSKHLSQIPKPMGINSSLSNINYANQPVSEPSDSQQEEIPLVYYQKEFKTKMAAQCHQQINYLYFSKNQSIKEWSQSLLAMFEKHDKEIVGLRKKMRYLKKFDDKFFATDIYNNQ